jgi:guanosine-3',5'-bis(diphosphate) 3'-pyrophosphohydrolase
MHGEVIGREKHLYSIYKKMKQKQLSFSEVMDVYAFRIIVDSVDTCYRVLGAMHNLYTPVPGKFKDYIAIPKANGYQSLHTVLFSPYGVNIEIQIRTEEMHRVAEAGIAAHWYYKEEGKSSNNAQVRAREWMHSLLEMQQNAGNSIEFLENVKIDLFPDEVYVFTPKGEIMELPRGATAVDFAYSVHSDIGNQCVAVKIDRRLMPLRTELFNGQTVEIITAPGARPNPAWLDFVHTAKARSSIRAYLKNLQEDEAISLGLRLLDKSLIAFGSSFDEVSDEQVERIITEFHYETQEDLLASIGLGNNMPMVVAHMLLQKEEDKKGSKHKEQEAPAPFAITGSEGAVVTYAKCCRPIPGDPIQGFISSGRGIVIHTDDCNNVAEYRSKPEKWIDVQWEKDVTGEFPVEIRVFAISQRGTLATVAAAIADMEANIENVEIEERDGLHSTETFTVMVKDRQHLARIMRRLRSLEMVERIQRVKR